VAARYALAFLLVYEPQTEAVRTEMLGMLRAAGAQNDYRSSLVAGLIEAGTAPRDAFRRERELDDEEVYRWASEQRKQVRSDWSGSDSAPVLLESFTPRYPAELRAEQTDGNVTVQFVVGEDGAVQEFSVIASDHPAFSAAALEALARWRFRPGIKDRKPAATRIQIDFPFSSRK
jgi:TonB family protein